VGTEQKSGGVFAEGQEAASVVPRWEWRQFAAHVPVSAAVLSSALIGDPVESRETYLLSHGSPHNVKVRRGTLDIKELIRTSSDGLELWRPVLKSSFPIGRDVVTAMLAAWRVPLRHAVRERYDLTQLLEEVVGPDARLCAVNVTKRRTRLTIEHCPGEVVAIDVDGRRWHGVGFEHEDPRMVLLALGALQLNSHANANYPRALKRMLGWSAEAYE
jgi:exopolyphosphatase/guanosine-5'-triphosphate,3'-diphosphate pyrophosphatase